MTKKIIIVSGTHDAPGALALQNAARLLMIDADIVVLDRDDVISAVQSTDYIIYRVKSKTYSIYQSICDQLEAEKRQKLDAILNGFDKAKTQTILENHNIPTPSGRIITPDDTTIQYPTIIKILHGNQGNGVALLKSVVDFDNFKLEYPEDQYLAQEYIEEAAATDIRIFVSGNRVIGAMKRTSTSADFRANLHLGGVGSVYEPTSKESEMAIRASRAFGLDFSGVDVVHSARGPLVLEVNSSPGFSITGIIGIDVASEVIKDLIKE